MSFGSLGMLAAPTTGDGGNAAIFAALAAAGGAAMIGVAGGGTVQSTLDALQYAGLAVALSAAPNQIEIGDAANVVVSWTITGHVSSQTLNGTSLAASIRSQTFNAVNATTAFALSVQDTTAPGGTATKAASATATVLSKYYAGVVPSASPTDVQLRALGSQGFASSRAHEIIFNASGGAYPCYAWPASLGNLSSVKVGGLGFSDYTVTTRNVVNAKGATVSMNILVFNTMQNGASIDVQFS